MDLIKERRQAEKSKVLSKKHNKKVLFIDNPRIIFIKKALCLNS